MLAILNKELRSYFKSPIGYVFMAFYLIFFGISFIQELFQGNVDYTSVLGKITLIILLGLPILTMRLLSEEKRSKTDQLILTSPISTGDYVTGKFLAAVTLFLITTGITMLQPFSLSFLGEVPWPKVLGAYLGIILLGSVFIAIGLFISALTESQVISAIATFFIFFILVYIGNLKMIIPADGKSSLYFIAVLILLAGGGLYQSTKSNIVAGAFVIGTGAATFILYLVKPMFFDGFAAKFLSWFSLFDRYASGFHYGILDISTVIYYLSFAAVFVFLTIQVVEKRRWS